MIPLPSVSHTDRREGRLRLLCSTCHCSFSEKDSDVSHLRLSRGLPLGACAWGCDALENPSHVFPAFDAMSVRLAAPGEGHPFEDSSEDPGWGMLRSPDNRSTLLRRFQAFLPMSLFAGTDDFGLSMPSGQAWPVGSSSFWHPKWTTSSNGTNSQAGIWTLFSIHGPVTYGTRHARMRRRLSGRIPVPRGASCLLTCSRIMKEPVKEWLRST